jgi:hypothetical protein
MEGLEEVISNLNKAVDEIKGKTSRGLIKAAWVIIKEARKLAPKDTGFLRRSAFVRWKKGAVLTEGVSLGFSAFYAIYVHENLQAKHTTGFPKFLEWAILFKQAEVLALIAEEARIK